ncbi:hypothetical protein ABT131_06460 [Streptomyces sp900105245]
MARPSRPPPARGADGKVRGGRGWG